MECLNAKEMLGGRAGKGLSPDDGLGQEKWRKALVADTGNRGQPCSNPM